MNLCYSPKLANKIDLFGVVINEFLINLFSYVLVFFHNLLADRLKVTIFLKAITQVADSIASKS